MLFTPHYPENKNLLYIDAIKYLWNSRKLSKRQQAELTKRDKLAMLSGYIQLAAYSILISVVLTSFFTG